MAAPDRNAASPAARRRSRRPWAMTVLDVLRRIGRLGRRARHRGGEDTPHSVRFLLEVLLQHRAAVVVAFLCGLLAAAFEGATMGLFAIALQTITDDAGLATEFGRLGTAADRVGDRVGRDTLFVGLVLAAVAAQLLRSSLQFVSSAAAAHLQANVEGTARRRLFRQFMDMDYAQARRYRVGDLSSHMEQVNYIGLVIQKLNTILEQFFLLTAYVVVLFWLSWPATIGAIVAVVVFSLALRRIVRRIRRISQRFRASIVTVSERTVEYLSGLHLLHAFGRKEYAVQSVESVIDDSVTARRWAQTWQATLVPSIDSLATVGIAVLLLGGYIVLGESSQSVLPRVGTFVFVLYRMMPRVSAINKYWGVINNHWPFIERTAGMLRVDDKRYLVNGTRPFAELGSGVAFRHVSLRYDAAEHPAVSDLSFSIERGQMVALVGASGAGKSSIANLLLRLYDPTDGAILVDGVDLREYRVGDWRSRVGVVSQNAFILHASVRDNIAFGRLEASEEEIVRAAEKANAHEFVTRLQDGYDTVVGDDGHRLSGGQRQRLAIARALVRRPDLLILDEATSDLDSEAEREVQNALGSLRGRQTILAVAHRLSTIMGADEIIVLEQGRIIERGAHEELLALDGKYAALFRIQGAGSHVVGAASSTVN